MKLIAKRKNVYVVEEKGKIRTIINDKYTELKLEEYNGNRIFYDFGDGLRVQETYDERIFNCYKDDIVINVRDGNKIAEFIADKNKSGYDEYFKEHYYQQHKSEFLDKIIKSYGDRVIGVRDGYVIDNIWKVDNKGTSYYHKDSWKGRYDDWEGRELHGETIQNANGWHFLCTVAQGKLLKMSIETDIGVLELDESTMTILAKINFLMNPNVTDSVFMNQLPDDLQKILKDEAKESVDTTILK